MTERRRLAAILVADVVGYSKLVGADETGTLVRLAALRRDVIDPAIDKHSGRMFKAVGDGFLVEFSSAVQAVSAAQAIQQRNTSEELLLRIGIHVGDVVVQGDDLMGDGVNIAARIEGIAGPGSIAISREVHAQVRDKLDVAFVDKGEVMLKNIARPVQVFTLGGGEAVTASPALALPDKPSVAVLPFQNMSGDPEQEYFVDGLVEDIITALSRTRSLFVIARNSSFTYKGQRPEIRSVGSALGVRYVLEGSVRKAGGQVRITGQLIDSSTAAHLWADRIDCPLDDVFELQDQVAASVTAAILPAVVQAEAERARSKPTADLKAYDHYLQGMYCLYKPTAEANDEAIQHFRHALRLDPTFARAAAQIAYAISRRKSFGWSADLERDAEEAEALIGRAIDLDSHDPTVLAAGGWALAYLVGRVKEGTALLDKAIELDANLFMGWLWRGWCSVMLAEDDATTYLERALRLSPLDPRVPSVQSGIASAHLQAGRYSEAAEWAAKAIPQRPNHLPGYLVAMAAHGLAGRMEEARSIFATYQKLDPEARVSTMNRWLRVQPAVFEKWAEGFRRAGMPE